MAVANEQLPKTVGNYDAFNPAGEPGTDISYTVPEGQEKEVVKIDDFKNIIRERSGESPVVEKSGEKKETKKEETPKAEEKEKEEPKTEIKPQEIKPLELPQKKVETVVEQDDDTKLYGETAAKFFKKMANEAAEFVRARLKENNEYKTKITELEKITQKPTLGYLDHEQGYTLTPEYGKAIGVVNQLQNELGFWNEQFDKIRGGQKWQDLVPSPDGKSWIKVEKEPSAQAERQVINYLNRGQQLLTQQEGIITNLAQNFKSSYDTRKNELGKLVDEIFPAFKDPEKNSKNQHYQNISGVLKSRGLENEFLAEAFRRLYTFTMEQGEYARSLESAQEKEKKLAESRVKAGPTSQDINNTGGKQEVNPDKEVIDFSEFDKIKRGF